jgi:hypothetical protein
LLLPRGALLFELFYGPHGLKQYVGIDGLLGQAVSVDILFFRRILFYFGFVFGDKGLRAGTGTNGRGSGANLSRSRVVCAQMIRLLSLIV